MSFWLKALIALIAAAAMLTLGVVYGDDLSPWMTQLETAVQAAFWPTWWVFVGVFVVAALVALPVGALWSMAGGLLFGTFFGGLAGWLSTSIAAWLSFLLLRWWLGKTVEPKPFDPRVRRLAIRLDQHSLELLMVLRIMPLIPFYLINLAASMSPMSAGRYLLASVIGLAPSTFLYAMVGSGLGSWVEAKAAWDQGNVLDPSLIGMLLALGLLAAVSIWGARRLSHLSANELGVAKHDWSNRAKDHSNKPD